MEQKKFDVKSLIGVFLIFGILMWMTSNNSPKEEITSTTETEAVASQTVDTTATSLPAMATGDSLGNAIRQEVLKSKFGAFAYGEALASAPEGVTVIENEKVKITVANKGGQVQEVEIKGYERKFKGSGEVVKLANGDNASFGLEFFTKDNRAVKTTEMQFVPTLTKEGDSQILSMKMKAGENQFLEYLYVLPADEYMLDFAVRSQGLSPVVDTAKEAKLVWDVKTIAQDPSVSYENRYTEFYYEYEDGKDDYLGQSGEDIETEADVTWMAYKQHFFTSILLTKSPFEKAEMTSRNLVNDEDIDTLYTKQFISRVPLKFNSSGELNYDMNLYYGPADYSILKSYDRNIEEIIALGWGIFGWINKFIFIPLFGFLVKFMPHGIAIILFTILIKLVMSPITYKSFLSQAKMKVLRPELTEINQRVKDPMKRQQETMALYNKAGVNPMAGCIPALIQMPFLYASFLFFPTALSLRHEGFLWANDLASFDAIVHLPFRIPIYGAHISLFPILAAIAIFFYMKLTTGDQAMQAPQQEGMPDMAKIMKIMIYVSPIFMLIFFNNYGSGLSIYNLVSNLITIAIMLVIKNYVLDDTRIHARIQENKTKPKTEGKFQRKMREMMEAAEEQKRQQQNRK